MIELLRDSNWLYSQLPLLHDLIFLEKVPGFKSVANDYVKWLMSSTSERVKSYGIQNIWIQVIHNAHRTS